MLGGLKSGKKSATLYVLNKFLNDVALYSNVLLYSALIATE